MVQTLEAIRGGGGSIKVGTTGTISALMSRELQSTSTRPFDLVSTGDSTPKKLKPKLSMDEGSSSKSNVPKTVRKTKPYAGISHQAAMLTSDNTSIDGTPARQKPVRIVEIVDIKCGNPDKNWINPISNRLKKLGFSKLSDSINS